MRIERSEMLSEGAGTPRLTAPSGMYLITWKRIKGINHHPTPKSGLEEDERGGTIICGGDAGLSGDAATETCKWGSLEHLWLFMGCISPNLLAKELFLQFLAGFGFVLLSERSSGMFTSQCEVQKWHVWEI